MVKLRIASCVLLLTMLLVSVAGSFSVLADDVPLPVADSGKTSEEIMSAVFDAYSSLSIYGYGGAVAHGGHQTRLLYTTSGAYMTCPGKTAEGSDGNVSVMGLWKINEDGTSRELVTFPIEGISAGTTSQVMADAAGNVWVVSSWEIGSGFYQLHAWKYDPVADEVTHIPARGYAKRGSMWGKPIAIMDAKYNRIYIATCGNSPKSGYFMWTTFDIGTETWNTEMKVVKIEARCDYHYGYADGRGGFYTVAENCLTNYLSWTNIEGMNAQQAIETFRSRKGGEEFVWMEPHMLYVPDPEAPAADAKAYDVPVERGVFDVENGCYPAVRNWRNDLFLDEETGYLYSIVTTDDSGSYGIRINLYVFDTKTVNGNIEEDGVFPLVAKTTLGFVLGKTAPYTQHFFKDAEGNLYIIAVPEEKGMVEIWKAKDNSLATEFSLVYVEEFKGALNMSSGTGVYSTMINTNRNNSLMGDLAYMAAFHGMTWYNFTVDFEALRTYLAQK